MLRGLNDSRGAHPYPFRAPLLTKDAFPMTSRNRLALLFLVLTAFVAAHASRAAAHPAHPPRRHLQSILEAREQQSVVRFARQLLGVRYVYGGTSPSSGFDCSGFTRFVYAHFGIDLPHYSGAQFDLGRSVTRGNLSPGDLVFFDGLGHVGIYVGGGRFIHAPHSGTRVSIESLSGWYGSRYDGARRMI
jgi:cell wall-associated NlpC family hydrolase